MVTIRRSRRTRRSARDGGFTLIELIVIIIIIGVLAAAAAPTLNSMTDTRAALAGRQLLRDLTFARQRAVATGTPCWVDFDTTAQTWTILAEDPARPGRDDATILVDPASGQSFIQALNAGPLTGVQISGVSFDSFENVGFDWLGRSWQAQETSPGVFTESLLAAQGSVTLTGGHLVTVEADTGHVAYAAP
ncbi:MAG: GspH/FimT family protein [Planctomycetota bacterium]|jgi:type II secretion system protein H